MHWYFLTGLINDVFRILFYQLNIQKEFWRNLKFYKKYFNKLSVNQKTFLQHEWISLNLHKNLHFLTKTKELFYPPPMTSELIHTKKKT